ncbi:MAG: PDZ domain-containing protein [Polyangiales bacterium]
MIRIRLPKVASLRVGLALAPMAAALLLARPAPAGPPGPWVFIPPPGGSAPAKPKPAPSGKGSVAPLPSVLGPGVIAPPGPEGMERARIATVVIERGKKPIALGILLSEKNVILTARSPIVLGGGTEGLEVRFPESNQTTKVKLHHEDEPWDLALLVPYSAKGTVGANASDSDPTSPSATFSTFVLLKNGKVQPQSTAILGRRDYLSPDGETLKDALSIDPKNVAIGTPLVDANGGVVGLVGRACAPGTGKAGAKSTCSPALFSATIKQIRQFLKTSPPIKAPTPWLGVVGLTDKVGVRVIQVQEGSPAATAGLKGGDAASADYVLAVDGVLVKTSEELSEQVKKHAPGDDVKLLCARAGIVREVKVTLKDAEGESSSGKAPSSPVPIPSILVPLPPLPPVFGPPAKSKLESTSI